MAISMALCSRIILKLPVKVSLSAEFPHSLHIGKKVILDTVLKMQWPWYHCSINKLLPLMIEKLMILIYCMQLWWGWFDPPVRYLDLSQAFWNCWGNQPYCNL